jgi:Hereditary spastic paraplegia protein strumpellin
LRYTRARCLSYILQVAQGNVLTAEVLRLSGEMPAALRDAQSRFARVLPDFAYLKDAAAAERRIEASAPLTALDDEFREV